MRVVVKSVNKKGYERSTHKNSIAEAEAMEMCKESRYVVGLVDYLEVGEMVYIVSKFQEGGDLRQYLCR